MSLQHTPSPVYLPPGLWTPPRRPRRWKPRAPAIIRTLSLLGGDPKSTLVVGANGAGIAASASTDTWNSSDKSAGITLSNGNLTAACSSASGVRSITGHSSGKYHFELTVDTLGANVEEFGFASAGHSLTDYGSGGTDAAAMGNEHFARYVGGSSNLGTLAFDWHTSDVVAFEVDFGGAIFRCQNFTQSSGWSSDFSLTGLTGGPWYIRFNTDNATATQVTLNTGGSAYAVTPTAGFGNW